MGDGLAGSFLILMLGAAVTAGVGLILMRSGRALLADAYEDERTVAAVTRLVVVLFGLVVMGVVVLLSTAALSAGGLAETVLLKLGLALLVVGVAYGATLLVLARIRAARREQRHAELTRESRQRAHRATERPPVIAAGPPA